MIIWLLAALAVDALIDKPSWPAALILSVCIICWTVSCVMDRVMRDDGGQS